MLEYRKLKNEKSYIDNIDKLAFIEMPNHL